MENKEDPIKQICDVLKKQRIEIEDLKKAIAKNEEPFIQVQMQSEHLDKLFEALAKAWTEIKDPVKNSAAHNHKYAKLDEYLIAIRSTLGEHGLSVVQLPMQTHLNKNPVLVTILGHESGQWIKSTIAIDIDKYKKIEHGIDRNGNPKDPKVIQQLGGIITYLRRYALAPIVGVCHKDDDFLDDK